MDKDTIRDIRHYIKVLNSGPYGSTRRWHFTVGRSPKYYKYRIYYMDGDDGDWESLIQTNCIDEADEAIEPWHMDLPNWYIKKGKVYFDHHPDFDEKHFDKVCLDAMSPYARSLLDSESRSL